MYVCAYIHACSYHGWCVEICRPLLQLRYYIWFSDIIYVRCFIFIKSCKHVYIHTRHNIFHMTRPNLYALRIYIQGMYTHHMNITCLQQPQLRTCYRRTTLSQVRLSLHNVHISKLTYMSQALYMLVSVLKYAAVDCISYFSTTVML